MCQIPKSLWNASNPLQSFLRHNRTELSEMHQIPLHLFAGRQSSECIRSPSSFLRTEREKPTSLKLQILFIFLRHQLCRVLPPWISSGISRVPYRFNLWGCMVLFFGRKGNWIYISDVLQIFAIQSFATWYGIPTVCLLGLESGFLGCSPVTPELLPWIKDSAVFVCCLSVLGDLISDVHLLCMQVGSCWRSTISTCCSCGHSCGYHDSSSGKIERNEQQCESMNEKFWASVQGDPICNSTSCRQTQFN